MKPFYADEWVSLYHGDCLELADLWTPVWLAMDPQHGTVDHLQIGGAATWL